MVFWAFSACWGVNTPWYSSDHTPFPTLEWMKILKCSSVELQLGLPWQQVDTESGKKAAIGWSCALRGYHSKVTLRSSQGHCKVKLAKNMIFRILYPFQTHLGCRWVLLTTAVDTLLVGYQFTTHRKGFVCSFSFEGWLPPWYSPYHNPFPKLEWNGKITEM